MQFSDELESYLRTLGWTPQRCVEIEPWVQLLTSLGLRVVPDAVRILREFGGLSIIPLNPGLGGPCGEPVLIDPESALDTISLSNIDYWEKHLGARLTPFADVGGIATELVSSDGKVYFSFGPELWLHGESFEDAAENRLFAIRRDSLRHIGDIRDDPEFWKSVIRQ